MFILAAAAALAATQPHPPTAQSAQATATIRVLASVRIKFDAPSNDGAPQARDTVVAAADGTIERAKLIEFQ